MNRCFARQLLLITIASIATSAAAMPIDDAVYVSSIKPILAAKCYSCHGVLKSEAGLRLETRQLMLQGGDSGAALIPGESLASSILQRITADEDSRMPPEMDGAALSAEEISLIKKWIDHGAVAPKEKTPEPPTQHWAFQRINAPVTKILAGNPIDALLQQKRRPIGLQTQPTADRSILIRRLYLDLIGLPPSLEQLHDDRPWSDVVDELLASPHHGERWGRHWMDVWRYSDWYGLGAQLRYSQKHLWHWRDWIVDSLNSDKGYDRMILEMLAGDELAPEAPEVVAATGFLARNYYLFNRTTWLDSTIEHTGKAFLGLTLNCAKCHDHKYDPITHVDYYNFRSFFEPHQIRLDPISGSTDLEKNGLPRAYDDAPDARTFLHIRGNEKEPDSNTEILPRVPAILASFQPAIESIELPAMAYAPGIRSYVQRDHLQAARNQLQSARTTHEAARRKLNESVPTQEQSDTASSEFNFFDDFETSDSTVWEVVGNGWTYKNGSVHQTTATRDAEFLSLKKPLPSDFEVTCRYTLLGGTTYKSVTFRFDESKDRKHANSVYTSAHAPGPKVQAAYSRNGMNSYPPQGRISKPITVGKTYDLRFAVRDRLMNVWLNDEFVLAYEFPDRQPQGRFSLSGFDAQVAFDSIRITALPGERKLTAAKNSSAPGTFDAATTFKLTGLKLKAAEAKVRAIEAINAADTATYSKGSTNAELLEKLKRLAAILEAESLLAQAAVDIAAAVDDGKKVTSAKAHQKTAAEKLNAAKAGQGSYTSIRASRKALETPKHKESDYPTVYSPVSTGRRLSLARWITSPENPLTARVAVNHVWMRHFGTPLVESVFDFGLRAKEPLHKDVLDSLAWELMNSGWSFKHLHRLIVTSQTYQLSSSTRNADSQTLQSDAGNAYYWRMNSRRMESQVVRDSLLQLSGILDPQLGGPSLNIGNDSRRRSLYYKHSRDQQDKFLSMFDDADLLQCYRRSESIVPQQALALANSELALSMAEKIAAKIATTHPNGGNNEFGRRSFELLLGRAANPEELTACVNFLIELSEAAESNEANAAATAKQQTRLIHSLLNHNDFISIR